MEGKWIKNPASDTSVVFVHGFLSSGAACWQHGDGAFWPSLLADEQGLEGLGIYVFTYQTGIFSGTYSLSDVVDSLKEHLRVDNVLPCGRLIFVCHSMGGIVVRKFLVERSLDLIEIRTEVGLFLVASPSLGSDYADWLSPLAKLFSHTQADALRFVHDNIWLSGLDKEFKNLKETGKLRLKGKELVEDKFVTLRSFWRKLVVPTFSGAVYFGEPYKVPGSDHFSISKPSSNSAIQHKLLVLFVKELLIGTMPAKQVATTNPTQQSDKSTSGTRPVYQQAPAPSSGHGNIASISKLLADLCSKDPLIAMPAGAALRVQTGNSLAIIDRPKHSFEQVPLTAARMALYGKKDAAAELASRILSTQSPDSEWHVASAAAHDLDPSHHEHCADDLGKTVQGSVGHMSRNLYVALGNLGAVEWGWELFRKHKANGRDPDIALTSFANMFTLARSPGHVRTASGLLRQTLILDRERKSNGYAPLTMRLALGRSQGAQIDCFLTEWAASDSALVRQVAADALGDCGIQRSVPSLAKLLGDSDASVRNAASLSLGAIGTADALAALLRSAPTSDGVSFCLHLITDDAEFRSRASELLDDANAFRWAAIRAVGVRNMADLSSEIRQLVHSPNELERGCSLLALARFGEAGDRERIETGFHESSTNNFEKVMASLALLVSAPERYPDLQETLRDNLSDMSCAFWKPAQQDILDVLQAVGNPQATALANAWRPFYSGFRPAAKA